MHISLVFVLLSLSGQHCFGYPICPGNVELSVNGATSQIAITRNNHSSAGSDPYYSGPVDVNYEQDLIPGMTNEITSSGARVSGRAYFADSCTEGEYVQGTYSALDLLDSSIIYNVNLSAALCGCNAALYLVSMNQNTDPSSCDDYYCDANSVCGVACTEIDIQEANMNSWLTTAHMSDDPNGVGVGYGGGGDGWSGPRDFTSTQYGPNEEATINTNLPFQVTASFPTTNGVLSSIDMLFTQDGKQLDFSLDAYSFDGVNGFIELTDALKAGMTPVVSYWSSYDMAWLDGLGSDGQGACSVDVPAECGNEIIFSDFQIVSISSQK